MSESPFSTPTEFVRSLNAPQRSWYLAEHAARENRLQRVLVDLGRGLSGVVAAHGEAVHIQQVPADPPSNTADEADHGS